MKLMTHVVVGYPTLKDTVRIVETMVEAGVDMVELQIPFSDPLADGPTIMRACEESLKSGTKVKDAMTIMNILSSRVTVPLYFMAYYNTVFRYGTDRFCQDAKNAGATGLIAPDMALDEEPQEHFIASCKKYNLHNIQVVSPASTDKRLKKNATIAHGFVYATARQGITGAKNKLDPQIRSYLANVKKYFSIPVAVGFGISQKQHIEILKGQADIAVIGSAIIDILNASTPNEYQKNIHTFVRSLRP
jgi:tryptophan synthase alpha chain